MSVSQWQRELYRSFDPKNGTCSCVHGNGYDNQNLQYLTLRLKKCAKSTMRESILEHPKLCFGQAETTIFTSTKSKGTFQVFLTIRLIFFEGGCRKGPKWTIRPIKSIMYIVPLKVLFEMLNIFKIIFIENTIHKGLKFCFTRQQFLTTWFVANSKLKV